MLFPSCMSHISSAQWPRVASGYYVRYYRIEPLHHCRKFYWTLLVYSRGQLTMPQPGT